LCARWQGLLPGGALEARHLTRKVDKATRKREFDSHGARLVHLIITMGKWIRTSRLSIKNSVSDPDVRRGWCIVVTR